MKILVHILLIMLLALIATPLQAQGISRAQGIGLRLTFWNITGGRTAVSFNSSQGESTVDLSGVGPSICYFSRAWRDLFLEMSLGVIGGGNIRSEYDGHSDVRVESIVPFVAGLRYDFLSSRVSGALHPYLSFGGGPYTAFHVQTTQVSPLEEVDSGQGTVETRMEYGWYLGTGLNFVLTSWFAINADLKYNFFEIPEVKDYSGVALGIGTTFMWGKQKSIYEITDVKVVLNEIYPVQYQSYANFPIVMVTVKNLVGHPIEVNIRGQVKGFSQRTSDARYFRINGGDQEDIPVTVYFGNRLLDNEDSMPVVLNMDVEVRATKTLRTELSAEIMLHGRNAWDGNMDMLPRFVTPEDGEIRDVARAVLLESRDPIEPGLEKLVYARLLFDELGALKIRYLPDPNIPFYQDDRVQFAHETIDAGSGDCDDLVVLYASLLESVGIRTAVVEVRDPEKELAHLYLLFCTGLKADEGYLISENEKRYIVRDNSFGQKMVWIPVETTLVQEGFQNAWEAGAMAWLQESILRNGLVEEWVRVIDSY
ncbi:hypothetical protein JXA02_10630 [candidate division KSB1 bacterium]|nr:hypothetical protein [candidate division KSB1 bacterium]RQW03230.1 MAG: hypothetical protein EH222_12715 [candidate division KSB1 bacterium]